MQSESLEKAKGEAWKVGNTTYPAKDGWGEIEMDVVEVVLEERKS